MSFNLIDLVKDQLSDQVMGSLGGAIGGNSSQNDLAVNSAIPSLLGSLTNFGGSPSNADLMFKGIEAQDDGILDNLGDLLGGSGQSGLLEGGTKILSSLLGGGGLGSLVGSIAGSSGAGKSGTSKLLGLLAPIIFGVIKRKLMGGGGFNVSSLMSLLNGQKSNVAAAMPSGFNLISSGSDTVESIAERTADSAQTVAKEGSSFIGKLLPLALLAGAGWLAYNYFMNKPTQPVSEESSTTTIQPAQPKVAPTNVGSQQTPQVQGNLIDIEKNIGTAMSSMTTSLGGITDVASAKAAMPNITEASGQLGSLAGLFAKLPEAARGPITKIVGDNIPMLQEVINKVGAIPGVGDIIKPMVEKLSSTLAMFK